MAITLTTTINAQLALNNISLPDVTTFAAAAMSHKGQYGVQLVTITDEHRLQKRALAALLGKKVEVKKISEASNAMFGWDYERVVKARIAREGGSPSSFKTEAPFGKSWVPTLYGIALSSNSTPDVYYLRSYQCKATTYRKHYVVDGKLATPQEEAAIAQCLRDPTPSQKQGIAGISEENEVMPRDYTFSNIYGMFVKAWNIAFGQTYDQIITALS